MKRTKRIAFFASTVEDASENRIDIEFAKLYFKLKGKTGLSLETFALVGSSVTISIIIGVTGFIIEKTSLSWIFLLSGIPATIMSIWIELRYGKEKRLISGK